MISASKYNQIQSFVSLDISIVQRRFLSITNAICRYSSLRGGGAVVVVVGGGGIILCCHNSVS